MDIYKRKEDVYMGTHGCYGFRKNGMDKLTYNHYDSDPGWLGRQIVKFCKETSIAEMNEIFNNLVLVDEDGHPTPEQIAECKQFYNADVSTRSIRDWYCLLHASQGEPDAYKNGLKYMIDNHDFIKDSLFCEYAYIINLDTNQLEFYIGFQKTPDVYNRYGVEHDDDGYYPCKLMAIYPLDSDEYSADDIVKDMSEIEN